MTFLSVGRRRLEFTQGKGLFRAYLAFSVVVVVFVLLHKGDLTTLLDYLAALLITLAALLPGGLWCSGRVKGVPLLPGYSLTYIAAFAIPFLSDYRIFAIADETGRFVAALHVAGFLLVSTLTWLVFHRRRLKTPRSFVTLDGDRADWLFHLTVVVNAFFTMSMVGGWFFLPGGVFSLTRALVLGLSAIAIFVLSFRLGAGEMSRRASIFFAIFLASSVVANAATLLLINAIVIALLAIAAYSVGRRKIAIVPLVALIVVTSVLHQGKREMRNRYWLPEGTVSIQPWEYPAFFAEWLNVSRSSVRQEAFGTTDKGQTLLERAGLAHIFVLVRTLSPQRVPYLSGETYRIIPQLLVPRVFNPNKIASHEGTYLLNIAYGIQTRADTTTTTIAWGLLNEALANFGLIGCYGLAVLLGIWYAFAARVTIQAPLLSFRGLFGLLVASMAIQSEFTAGVYVSALFQSMFALVALRYVFMKRQLAPQAVTKTTQPSPSVTLPVGAAASGRTGIR
jgi:hypothetical protein